MILLAYTNTYVVTLGESLYILQETSYAITIIIEPDGVKLSYV